MGMGAGCRTPGRAPVRAGTPIRQHAPIAPSFPLWVWVCVVRSSPWPSKEKRHKHKLSEVRADFLDRRWTDPPPWRAERARGGAGGAARGSRRRSKKSARTSESLCLCRFSFFDSLAAFRGSRRHPEALGVSRRSFGNCPRFSKTNGSFRTISEQSEIRE